MCPMRGLSSCHWACSAVLPGLVVFTRTSTVRSHAELANPTCLQNFKVLVLFSLCLTLIEFKKEFWDLQ